MNPIISVENLSKVYGTVTAVDDVSFTVAPATTFAFLGTNGAGKSTTIGCITSLLEPTSGNIVVDGKRVGRDDREIRNSIGVVFQESLLDPILTVRENLLLRTKFYGLSRPTAIERIDELCSLLELETFIDRGYRKLSGGQKRRADIVRALLHRPSILFLDEPTTGLDPESRERVWATVTELQRGLNLTVFLTTHYMQETEVADSVRIINRGRIVAEGTPSELRARYASDELRLTLTDPTRFDTEIADAGYSVRTKGVERFVSVPSSRQALEVLKRFEADSTDFEFRHGTMDDVFLNVTREATTS